MLYETAEIFMNKYIENFFKKKQDIPYNIS